MLVVLGLRRASGWLSVGAAIKVAPGLGIPYLALRGRWREAGLAVLVGLGILIVSVVATPDAWRAYLDFIRTTDPLQPSSFVPIAWPIRAAAGVVLAVVAARLPRDVGDPLAVVAITLTLPSLWVTGLSLLVAIVPLVVGQRAAIRADEPPGATAE